MFTAATGSSVAKIHRRSLAIYGPTERAFVENNVYNMQYPKILILEGMCETPHLSCCSSLIFCLISDSISERSCLLWLVHSSAK